MTDLSASDVNVIYQAFAESLGNAEQDAKREVFYRGSTAIHTLQWPDGTALRFCISPPFGSLSVDITHPNGRSEDGVVPADRLASWLDSLRRDAQDGKDENISVVEIDGARSDEEVGTHEGR